MPLRNILINGILRRGTVGAKVHNELIEDLPADNLDAEAQRRLPPDPASLPSGNILQVGSEAEGSRTWTHGTRPSGTFAGVSHDDTLTGDGHNSQLGVARPFTAADEQKVDALRYEGRVRWSGTITIATSTSPQWGEATTLRGFADTAEPVDHAADTSFGSLSDNTDGDNRVYRLYYNSADKELVFSIANDPDLSSDVLVVDSHQLHFDHTEKLDPSDTGGNFTLYTWTGVPAVLQGANASYSIIEPLADDDYLPQGGSGYLKRTADGDEFTNVDYSDVQNAPAAPPAIVESLEYNPAIGTEVRISGVKSYIVTVVGTVTAPATGEYLVQFDDQAIGGVTLASINAYDTTYRGTLSPIRNGRVFATYIQANNAVANASVIVNGESHSINATWLDQASSQHEHEIPDLSYSDFAVGTPVYIQFVIGSSQSPASKSIGEAGEILQVQYSARDQWVYSGFAPLDDTGKVQFDFWPFEVMTAAAYTQLVNDGNRRDGVLYLTY